MSLLILLLEVVGALMAAWLEEVGVLHLVFLVLVTSMHLLLIFVMDKSLSTSQIAAHVYFSNLTYFLL